MRSSASVCARGRCNIQETHLLKNRRPGSLWPVVARALVNTLWPPRCHVCGCPIAPPPAPSGRRVVTAKAAPDRSLRGRLCAACADALTLVRTPLCPCCGKMFLSRQGPDHLCDHCSRHAWHFSRARAAGVFDRSLATLVHRLKYGGRTGLVRPLGWFMFKTLQDNWRPGELDGIVPVPLHPARLRARGFNQSQLLARTWACRSGTDRPGWTGIPLETDLIERVRPTVSQTGLGRQARLTNLRGAFRLKPERDIANLRLLLVDDVFTTGATVNECARILMQAGAGRVDVLTLARTHTE